MEMFIVYDQVYYSIIYIIKCEVSFLCDQQLESRSRFLKFNNISFFGSVIKIRVMYSMGSFISGDILTVYFLMIVVNAKRICIIANRFAEKKMHKLRRSYRKPRETVYSLLSEVTHQRNSQDQFQKVRMCNLVQKLLLLQKNFLGQIRQDQGSIPDLYVSRMEK